jgi:hypothetical protein
MILDYLRIFLAFAVYTHYPTAFGQGALAVTPMSLHTSDKQAVLRSSIQNMTPKSIQVEIKLDCDVDGIEMTGADCEKKIKFTTDGVVKNGNYEIGANSRISISASLVGSVESYALFKPYIRPLLRDEKNERSSVGFEFNYRPGFLFLLRPASDVLAVKSFSTKSNSTARQASFIFDIRDFKSPHVVTISAKLIHKNKGQMVRFLRLAEEKILDPKRQTLELEGEYAKISDPELPLCYELYIQEKKPGASLQKISDCKR